MEIVFTSLGINVGIACIIFFCALVMCFNPADFGTLVLCKSQYNFEKELLNQIIAFEIEKSVQEDMGCYTVADVTQIQPE